MEESNQRTNLVGPVLEAGEVGNAVIAAIRNLNREVLIQDRGSYFRVLVAGQCVVTRQAIEGILGRPFLLSTELEQIMPAFKGRLSLTEDQAVWS
jgi:hypothetical protein